MHFSTCLLVFSALLALAATGSVAKSDAETPGHLQPVESAKSRFKLLKVFDFEHYKQLYKKSYSSAAEELARQKLFLGRLFRAVISMVKYKMWVLSHYLSINEWSDKTPEEIEQTKLPTSAFVLDEFATSRAETVKSLKEEELVPAASESDIQLAIEEIAKRKGEPGYKEIAHELGQALGNNRRRRHVSGEGRSALSLNDLIESPTTVEEPSDASPNIQHRPPSNNPEYEPPELDSFASAGGEPNVRKSMPEKDATVINKLRTGFSYVQRILRRTSAELAQGAKNRGNEDEKHDDGKTAKVDAAPEHKHVDLRESNCFHSPKRQGECGSCYAFAAVAMFEYLYCKATGKRVDFSPQFIIDCGHKVEGLYGCRGGVMMSTLNFIEQYGLELDDNYPYYREQLECPYGVNHPVESMGYLKLKPFKKLTLDQNDLSKYLPLTPILVSMKLTPQFREYGGGVDDSTYCYPNDNHAMLIVGSGTEDGKDYWLMRNSFSVAWGEGGYYKISTQAFDRCRNSDSMISSLALDLATLIASPDKDFFEIKKRRG